MPNKLNFNLFLLCVTLILSASVTSFGCWCRYPGTVLKQFENSKSVIVGRLASVSETEAKLVVDKVYKGKLHVGEQLKFDQGTFGNCLRGFSSEEIGQQYLFYLNQPPNAKVYAASICNRSNKIARAFADMAYLNKIDSVAGKTRVYGYFRTDETITPNVEGLVITITRLKTKNAYSVTTDKNGFFEFYDLPPGEYKLEPMVPAGWRIDEEQFFGIDRDPSWRVHAIAFTIKAKKDVETRIPIIRDNTAGGYPTLWFAPINDPTKSVLKILPREARNEEAHPALGSVNLCSPF